MFCTWQNMRSTYLNLKLCLEKQWYSPTCWIPSNDVINPINPVIWSYDKANNPAAHLFPCPDGLQLSVVFEIEAEFDGGMLLTHQDEHKAFQFQDANQARILDRNRLRDRALGHVPGTCTGGRPCHQSLQMQHDCRDACYPSDHWVRASWLPLTGAISERMSSKFCLNCLKKIVF